MIRTDFLVLGAGIAGLSYALKVARFFPEKKICVISKADIQEGNTRYAQGGIAAVLDLVQDSFESHLQDTLLAGGGLCEREIAEMVVREAPERIKDLLEWEVEFDSDEEGHFHLGKEGGHTHHRILHNKDSTGLTIEEALLRKAQNCSNILLLDYYFALDLILSGSGESKDCIGVHVLDLRSGKVEKILSPISMLACGGAGQVYGHTTNPLVATGDGIAMACRAGAEIENMEFIQFHPTALYQKKAGPAFLITEALRGFGAELRNKEEVAFMKEYHELGSLAPRDVVARAITLEMNKHNSPCLYLDARHLDQVRLREHFPMIYEKCLSIGVVPARDMIPVVPSAHYFCGGVKTDVWGRTSIKNLFASGECASTGLHGANRLASNSLLEALVFSHRAFLKSSEEWEFATLGPSLMPPFIPEATKEPLLPPRVRKYRKELKKLMDSHVSVIRSLPELQKVDKRIEQLYADVEGLTKCLPASVPLWELLNLLSVSQLVVRAALKRRKGVGLHYLA